MNDEPNDQPEPGERTGVTLDQMLNALESKPVFEFAPQALGPIQVTELHANTLERIALEFERAGADDDSKLRRLLREVGQTASDGEKAESISEAHASNVTPAELAEFAHGLLLSARLLTRAAALTNTCFTFANSGMSAFAAGVAAQLIGNDLAWRRV